MMIYPPIAKLVEKTGSRYTLVIETAKRARQLVAGSPALVDVDSNKEVTVAVNEIYEGRVEAVNVKEYRENNGFAGSNDFTDGSEFTENIDTEETL